jgi:flagellar hook-associated protein 3 FlgL
MRVTNSSTQRFVLESIQQSYSRLALYQRQVSSGKRIYVPSDDPVGQSRVLNYNSQTEKISQYMTNIDVALDEMQTTSNVMQNMLDRLATVKEIIVNASSDLTNPDALSLYGYQVEEILWEFVGYANTTVNGKYVFAGYETSTKPYDATDGADPDTFIDTVTYSGDTGQRKIEVNDGREITVNYVGDNTGAPGFAGIFYDANAPIKDVFQFLMDLRDDLIAGDHSAVRSTHQTNISDYTNHIETLVGVQGVQIQELMTLRDSHDSDNNFKLGLKSDIEDVDAFDAFSSLSNQQVAYQVALQVGAKVVSLNLFDFLD